jgi:hypothetical protein
MKDSGIEWIGEIPCDWKLERSQWHLEEVNISNNPIQTNNVLSLTNKLGVVPYEEKGNQGNKSKENVYEYKLAYPNTIVANSMNILIGSVGLCDYFGCVSPVYYVFKAKKHNNIKFLNYVFQTVGFQRELRKYANGILEIRLRVSASDILKRFIPFPSENEQQRIAEFLDRECGKIDGVKADIQAQIDTLEQYKRSIITEAVTHGLNPFAPMKDSGVDYIDKIKSDWRITKIGFVCSKLTRGFSAEDPALICSNNGSVMLRDEEKACGKMVSEDNAMQGIHIGDIAIHGMDTWHGAIGFSKIKGKITRVVHVCDSSEDKRFIVYYLKSLAYQNVYKLISNGVRGNTSDFRSWDKVKDIYICLPATKKEENEICDYLDAQCENIDMIIADKKLQIETLDGYKKSLIYEYVTGKKEVV